MHDCMCEQIAFKEATINEKFYAHCLHFTSSPAGLGEFWHATAAVAEWEHDQ